MIEKFVEFLKKAKLVLFVNRLTAFLPDDLLKRVEETGDPERFVSSEYIDELLRLLGQDELTQEDLLRYEEINKVSLVTVENYIEALEINQAGIDENQEGFLEQMELEAYRSILKRAKQELENAIAFRDEEDHPEKESLREKLEYIDSVLYEESYFEDYDEEDEDDIQELTN